MKKPLILLALAVVIATALWGGASLLGVLWILDATAIPVPGGQQYTGRVGSVPSPSPIPSAYAALYRSAAATCPGLPWQVLGAIGTIESSNGQSGMAGVHSGSNFAGAEGPMQFEPATFAQYANPVPSGGQSPPSPYNPPDAIYAAARDLCANGAGRTASLADAIFAYDHSRTYVRDVLGVTASLLAHR